MYIPDGFSTVFPYFFVRDAGRFIEFLLQAFEAEETARSLRPDGLIANAQMRIGTVTLMISEATEGYPPMAAAYYIYVENADQSMQQALDAGASLEMPAMDMPYGDRQGGVRDPFGNIWWVSQRLVEEPYQAAD